MEICPNCGNDTKDLDDYTGWCESCSAIENTKDQNCNRCGGERDRGKYCRKCREALWLEARGDEIDRALATGVSRSAAIKFVQEAQKKPHCVICNEPLRRPTNGLPLFCQKPICRRAFNKYRHFVYDKGINKEEAIEKVSKLFKGTAHADSISK